MLDNPLLTLALILLAAAERQLVIPIRQMRLAQQGRSRTALKMSSSVGPA